MKGVVKLQVSSGVNKVRKYFREHFRILWVITFALSRFRTFAFYMCPK